MQFLYWFFVGATAGVVVVAGALVALGLLLPELLTVVLAEAGAVAVPEVV